MRIILGAGIAGLAAAYHYSLHGVQAEIYEKLNTWGGHCDSFEVDGFRFDQGPHFSFTTNKYVQELFAKSGNSLVHSPEFLNYYQGHWLKHPVQNNLWPLSVEEKIKIITDFVGREGSPQEAANYETWLRRLYGNYFAENFPMRYTRKYWVSDASALSTDWIGNRLHQSSLEEILRGALHDDTPFAYYASELRYPAHGGFRTFLSSLAMNCPIHYAKEAIEINPDQKKISFSDGTSLHYERLISSLPLPEIIRLIPNTPTAVVQAAQLLRCSSVALVSCGVRELGKPACLMGYIYDENILPARFHSPSVKSPANAPPGLHSFQFEIYFSESRPLKLTRDGLVEHVLAAAEKMRLFPRSALQSIDCREIKYANVIFDHQLPLARKTVLDYLLHKEIRSIGRYGSWAYYWTDQSLLSGKQAAEHDLGLQS